MRYGKFCLVCKDLWDPFFLGPVQALLHFFFLGDTLKLKAVLLGEPAPDVTWYINGKKLAESNKIQILSEKGTYTVIIKDITCDYSGEVLCKAINEYGEASSSGKNSALIGRIGRIS